MGYPAKWFILIYMFDVFSGKNIEIAISHHIKRIEKSILYVVLIRPEIPYEL